MSKPIPFHGQAIVYTMGNLGVSGSDHLVESGDLGRFLGPADRDGWYYTEPAKCPGHICPVMLDMFETT